MYIPNANDYSLGYYDSMVQFTKAIEPKLKTILKIFKAKASVKNNKAERSFLETATSVAK